jgi:hypothetical protein
MYVVHVSSMLLSIYVSSMLLSIYLSCFNKIMIRNDSKNKSFFTAYFRSISLLSYKRNEVQGGRQMKSSVQKSVSSTAVNLLFIFNVVGALFCDC